ncbi:MAG: type III pantothenate kinase [Planctomycetota bacterium]
MVKLPVAAVDVGNARVKLGLFAAQTGGRFPEPAATLALDGRRPDWNRIGPWLKEGSQPHVAWWIGSVNRPATTRLLDWIRGHRPADPITLLAADDLPLVVELERPDMVGIDRLLDAVAANYLRQPNRPAVVVDVGTAITVDLVSAEGSFLGGAILPGIAMSARAMHEYTDLLPLVEMTELHAPPPALGSVTVEALRSGLFWGAVGAIRQLTERLAGDDEPQVFLTGGAGPAVAELLSRSARHVPHLTLAGIALTAKSG